MENVIVILILITLATAIIWHLIRMKKKGEKCIGCPYAKQCASRCNGNCTEKSVRST